MAAESKNGVPLNCHVSASHVWNFLGVWQFLVLPQSIFSIIIKRTFLFSSVTMFDFFFPLFQTISPLFAAVNVTCSSEPEPSNWKWVSLIFLSHSIYEMALTSISVQHLKSKWTIGRMGSTICLVSLSEIPSVQLIVIYGLIYLPQVSPWTVTASQRSSMIFWTWKSGYTFWRSKASTYLTYHLPYRLSRRTMIFASNR